MKFGAVPPREAEGAIAVHSIRKNGMVLKKGTPIGKTEIAALEALQRRTAMISDYREAILAHPDAIEISLQAVVDGCARVALCDGGKSLLAKGVVRTEGKFAVGDLVSIHDVAGEEFARGLVKATTGVMVHRDDLVVL